MLITTTTDGACAVIGPREDITFDTLPGLLTAYQELPPTVTEVTWDLQNALFMDVAGLHLLVQQRRDCRLNGRKLTVTGLRDQPLRLLQLTQELFPSDAWTDFLPRGLPVT